MAGTPVGALGAWRDRRAGKVRALDNLVCIYSTATIYCYWSMSGFQSVTGFERVVIHVVPPDGVDEGKEGSREKG